jgi:Type IV pilin-like G and H, putative
MKILLRSTLLFCLSLFFGIPVFAEPTPIQSTKSNQYSLTGTWSWNVYGEKVIFIFNNVGEITILLSKNYGDYKYYQFPSAEYISLMQQVATGKFEAKPQSPSKYILQGNMIEVLTSGTLKKQRIDFSNNDRTVNFTEENATKPSFSFQRVSDNMELPKETESLSTVENHFYGLHRLFALQVGQANYWLKKRRFAPLLQNLQIKSLPESDRAYRYELVKQSPRQNIIAAIPTQPNLRSFVLQLDRVGSRQQPFKGILCGTDRPSNQLPPLPQLKGKNLTCPNKTHLVDFNPSISQSLRLGN